MASKLFFSMVTAIITVPSQKSSHFISINSPVALFVSFLEYLYFNSRGHSLVISLVNWLFPTWTMRLRNVRLFLETLPRLFLTANVHEMKQTIRPA